MALNQAPFKVLMAILLAANFPILALGAKEDTQPVTTQIGPLAVRVQGWTEDLVDCRYMPVRLGYKARHSRDRAWYHS